MFRLMGMRCVILGKENYCRVVTAGKIVELASEEVKIMNERWVDQIEVEGLVCE